MSDFVVADASLAVKWLVDEDDSDKAHAILESWGREGRQIAAPPLLPPEVANALHRRVVGGDMEQEQAIVLIERLLASSIELHAPPGLHARAIELAGELGQGAVYDCHYLALAEALGCELWTADARFQRAASAAFDDVHALSEFTPPRRRAGGPA